MNRNQGVGVNASHDPEKIDAARMAGGVEALAPLEADMLKTKPLEPVVQSAPIDHVLLFVGLALGIGIATFDSQNIRP